MRPLLGRFSRGFRGVLGAGMLQLLLFVLDRETRIPLPTFLGGKVSVSGAIWFVLRFENWDLERYRAEELLDEAGLLFCDVDAVAVKPFLAIVATSAGKGTSQH